MSKQNEAPQQAQNAVQLVYVVTRWGQIYSVYSSIEDAQQMQKVLIAKGNICDIQVHQVKNELLKIQ